MSEREQGKKEGEELKGREREEQKVGGGNEKEGEGEVESVERATGEGEKGEACQEEKLREGEGEVESVERATGEGEKEGSIGEVVKGKDKKKKCKEGKLWDILVILLGVLVIMLMLVVKMGIKEEPVKQEYVEEVEEEALKIMIDIGHGGNDKGTQGNIEGAEVLEKEVNLEIGKKIIKGLERIEGIEVLTTRELDEDVSLTERVEKTKEEGADLFISVHSNAESEGESTGEVKGIETFYYAEGDDSRILGEFVQESMINWTGAKDRGVKYGNYQVLRENTVPAILIETGFLSNEEECKLLKNEEYQNKIVVGVINGILNYIEEEEKVEEMIKDLERERR